MAVNANAEKLFARPGNTSVPHRAARFASNAEVPRIPRTQMARFTYWLGRLAGRFTFFGTMRVRVIRPEAARRTGGFVLACTHISHLDPLCMSIVIERKIDWMARKEFFRSRWRQWMMSAFDTFSVNRQGVSISAIRTAIARVKEGRIVGIFPEGGVSNGADSACRGGPIKKGACVVALRADAPIVPCVILGTHLLNRVMPWMPFRRGRLWVIFGTPIEPTLDGLHRRAARERMGIELSQEFQRIYRELRDTCGIADSFVP
jgi:1-acyl-sn-glycerol-3-phosphate acyltransferase